MSVRVTLSPMIYGREGLDAAVAAYSGFCSVAVLGSAPRGYQIEIEGAPGVEDEVRVAREFLNYLLDVSLEAHLTKQ